MTVAELITRLQKAPNQQAPVRFSVDDRDHDDSHVFVVTSADDYRCEDDPVYLQNYRADGSEIEL